MSKQRTLGKFGFTKTVTKKGCSAKVPDISTVEDAVKYACEHCDLSFGNTGALVTHIKCKHGIVPVVLTPDTASVTVPVPSLPAVHAVESDNENDQLYSQTNSSSLNKTKCKNNDKYAHLKKKRLSYPANSIGKTGKKGQNREK